MTNYAWRHALYTKISAAAFVAVGLILISGSNTLEAIQSPAEHDTSLGQSDGPIVVELYQSQGCSSCPPANAALSGIAGRRDIIALSFAVTYWDRLGWKDIFGNLAYTQRQYAYSNALGSNGVYTPQVVLNGRRAIVGNRSGELERAVAATRKLSGGPSIGVKLGSVIIGAGKGSGDVLLVRYDPRNHDVAIRAGENSGRKLPHRNIVRQLVKLGQWDGNSVIYKIPTNPNLAWQSAILVQSKQTGPILAARKL